MPYISPLVKCAVILLGKKKKMANLPSSTWNFKILLRNLRVLKSIQYSKLSHCFLVLLPLSASILNFISYLDCQCFGAGTAISVSLWDTLLSGSRPRLQNNKVRVYTCHSQLSCRFTIQRKISCRGLVSLAGSDPSSQHFNRDCNSLKGPFPRQQGRDPGPDDLPIHCLIL